MVSVDTACGRYKDLPFIGSFLSVPIMYLLLLVYLLAVLINFEVSATQCCAEKLVQAIVWHVWNFA